MEDSVASFSLIRFFLIFGLFSVSSLIQLPMALGQNAESNPNIIIQNFTFSPITKTDTSDNGIFWQVLLVIIPTVGGFFTTKFVAKSWQEKKERSEIILKIQQNYAKYVVQPHSKLNWLYAEAILFKFDKDYNRIQHVGNNRAILDDLVKNSEDLQELIVNQQYWKLDSLLLTYYQDKNYVDDFHKIRREFYRFRNFIGMILEQENNILIIEEGGVPSSFIQAEINLGKKDNIQIMKTSVENLQRDADEIQKSLSDKVKQLRNSLLELDFDK